MGISHEKSKEIQDYVRLHPEEKSEVLMEMFSAKRGQVDYARRAAVKGVAGSKQSKPKRKKRKKRTNVLVPPMSNATDFVKPVCGGQPHVTGPLVNTERVLDSTLAIEEGLTGEDVMFSTADVIRLMQLANDEAVGLLKKCGAKITTRQ